MNAARRLVGRGVMWLTAASIRLGVELIQYAVIVGQPIRRVGIKAASSNSSTKR